MPTGGSEMTLLSLDGIDFTDYAVRGITAVVAPIETEGLIRDINGTLVSVADDAFRKLAIQLSCADVEAPDFSNTWQGDQVTVTLMPGVGADAAGTSGQLTVTCLVESWSVNRDEWGCVSDWQLNLLEV